MLAVVVVVVTGKDFVNSVVVVKGSGRQMPKSGPVQKQIQERWWEPLRDFRLQMRR